MAAGTAAPAEDRSTHFVFDHPVFRAAGAKFIIASDGSPAMQLKLADFDAIVPLRSLRGEFALDNTNDGELLDKVAAGLKFVKVIRPGDSIPREILDGTASWAVEERHTEIARGRISMQVSGWLTGQETVINDHDSLLQVANDPSIKAKVQEAFGEIARKLGLPPDRKEEVIDKIEMVVREMAYIEALRDRFALVRMIRHKIGQLQKLYRRDRTMGEEIGRIENLFRRPLTEIGDIFEQVDAQCGEILSLLRNLTRQIAFIRESRDELHTRLMAWDELLAKWPAIPVEVSSEVEQALKELYRFLARNFNIARPWSSGG